MSPKKVRFFLISLSIFAIDMAFFSVLYNQDFSLDLAHIVSFIFATGAGYFLSSIGSKREIYQSATNQFLKLIIATLLILFLRGGILASLIQLLDFPTKVAITVCVILSSVLSYISSVHYIFQRKIDPVGFKLNERYFIVALLIYSISLRFFYLGLPELFYQEAYYWNYAKHLDIGYLDHPPMIAWLIGFFTQLMGDNEFAVRFGAFVCWFIAAYFSYRLTYEVLRSDASRATLLVATLPAYFAIGFVMTPDAPLVACWAAVLYFLYQALIHNRRLAWAGVGISLGLGMLSKYTIILLVPAALLFILVDRPSRNWIFRPEPYLAVILATVIFSPVLIWNSDHEWTSFLYQSHYRITKDFEFFLFNFLGNIILIMTPTGILSVIAVVLLKKFMLFENNSISGDILFKTMSRSYWLLITLTLFPITVFAAISLFREVKFHWTVPCWLGIIPYLALIMDRGSLPNAHKLLEWIWRAWPTTIIICLIGYGAVLHYMSLGIPGIPYPQNSHLLGWQDFGREIQGIVKQIERETGEQILVVGMDRSRIASGLAFYRTVAIDSAKDSVTHQPAFQTSSWHLFGGKSLMFEYWFPMGEQNNKTLLLVSRSIDNLTGDHVRSRVREMGDIKEIKIWKNGRLAGLYYYSLAKGYQNKQPDANISTAKPSD